MSYADKGHNGLQHTPTPSYFIPKPVYKTEADPYPMTFVQADRVAFKQVVQLLTGSSETSRQASDSILSSLPAPSSKGGVHPRRRGTKLYERRNNNLKNCLVLNSVACRTAYGNNNSGFSPANPKVLSPSMLDFPRLVLSPVTPLTDDLFNKPSPCLEEEKAITEKRFYLPFAKNYAEKPRTEAIATLPFFAKIMLRTARRSRASHLRNVPLILIGYSTNRSNRNS